MAYKFRANFLGKRITKEQIIEEKNGLVVWNEYRKEKPESHNVKWCDTWEDGKKWLINKQENEIANALRYANKQMALLEKIQELKPK